MIRRGSEEGYSNKSRGMRRKAAEAEAADQPGTASSPEVGARGRSSQTWAMLVKRVYEIAPLRMPEVPGPDEVGRVH